MASNQRVPIEKQASIPFHIGLHHFQNSFLTLPTMSSSILSILFFKKYNINIDPKQIL